MRYIFSILCLTLVLPLSAAEKKRPAAAAKAAPTRKVPESEKFTTAYGIALAQSMRYNQPCPKFPDFQKRYMKEKGITQMTPEFKTASRSVVQYHANPIYANSNEGKRNKDVFKAAFHKLGMQVTKPPPSPGERRDLCAVYRVSWSKAEKLMWICDQADAIYCHDAGNEQVVHSLPPELREDLQSPSEAARLPTTDGDKKN